MPQLTPMTFFEFKMQNSKLKMKNRNHARINQRFKVIPPRQYIDLAVNTFSDEFNRTLIAFNA